jgi:hypothetical protein
MSQYDDIKGFFKKETHQQEGIITDVFNEYITLCQDRNLSSKQIFQEIDDLISNSELREDYETAHIFRKIKESIESSIEYRNKKRRQGLSS